MLVRMTRISNVQSVTQSYADYTPWVQHLLRMDEIQARFHTCTKNLTMITDEPGFLTRVINPSL